MIFGPNQEFLNTLRRFSLTFEDLRSDGMPDDLAWLKAMREVWPDACCDDGI